MQPPSAVPDPLTAGAVTNMQYSEREPFNVAAGLYDSLLGGISDVLYRWNIVLCGNSLSLGEKATRMQVISARDKVTSGQSGGALTSIEAR
jgi:hypothetical protein